uniref:Uncharacterized protein n=1 Tax=Timema tahoe TaxID=61484 RepID=A0A7R9IAY1_9NEOP|nr:unnamed protein product [Timema tahoe]
MKPGPHLYHILVSYPCNDQRVEDKHGHGRDQISTDPILVPWRSFIDATPTAILLPVRVVRLFTNYTKVMSLVSERKRAVAGSTPSEVSCELSVSAKEAKTENRLRKRAPVGIGRLGRVLDTFDEQPNSTASTFEKTDYSHSITSKYYNKELAPGVKQIPNMSRRSIHGSLDHSMPVSTLAERRAWSARYQSRTSSQGASAGSSSYSYRRYERLNHDSGDEYMDEVTERLVSDHQSWSIFRTLATFIRTVLTTIVTSITSVYYSTVSKFTGWSRSITPNARSSPKFLALSPCIRVYVTLMYSVAGLTVSSSKYTCTCVAGFCWIPDFSQDWGTTFHGRTLTYSL